MPHCHLCQRWMPSLLTGHLFTEQGLKPCCFPCAEAKTYAMRMPQLPEELPGYSLHLISALSRARGDGLFHGSGARSGPSGKTRRQGNGLRQPNRSKLS